MNRQQKLELEQALRQTLGSLRRKKHGHHSRLRGSARRAYKKGFKRAYRRGLREGFAQGYEDGRIEAYLRAKRP
jgi:flagellar biosynthesis/type III secretory pathway protein FliH